MQKHLQKYYDSDRATKAIYGAILIFAFLIGQEHTRHDSALPLIFSTLFAAIAIVLAEIYSELLGKTIKHKKALTKADRRELERDSLAIISVSLWPSFFFFLSFLGLYSIQSAFILSYILLISTIFAFSYWANRLSKYTKLKSFAIALAISALGLSVILIKYALTH